MYKERLRDFVYDILANNLVSYEILTKDTILVNNTNIIIFDNLDEASKEKKDYFRKRWESFSKQEFLTYSLREYDLQNESALKAILLRATGNIKTKIEIKDCRVTEVTKEEADKFLDENNIKGETKYSVKIGLKVGETLIAVMCFAKARKGLSTKEDENANIYEMVRFSTNKNYSFNESLFSLLFNKSIEILKEKGTDKIKAFVDLRIGINTDCNYYTNSGFILERISKPNYVYFKYHKNRLEIRSRYQCQKHKLEGFLEAYDKYLSEYKNMLANGYKRVYDCGNAVYYYDINKNSK